MAAVVLCTATLLGGCDLPTDASPRDDGAGESADAGATLTPPSFLVQSRRVDSGRLEVSATINDVFEARTEQRNGVWFTSFILENDGENTLVVTWSYRVPGREQPIVIAESAPITVSLASSPRNLTVSTYDTNFDDDNDGDDNLLEIENGTSPVQVLAPGVGQGDCRSTRFPGALAADEEAPRDEIALSTAPVDDTVAVEFDVERRVYFATFQLEVAGTLTVEHLQGTPINTNAVLYDRNAASVGADGTANVSVVANPTTTSDGVRARVSAALSVPGLYCYVLFDERVNELANSAPLDDLVLRVVFSPAN